MSRTGEGGLIDARLRRRLRLLWLILALLLALTAAWRWSPLSAWLDAEGVVAALRASAALLGAPLSVLLMALALSLALPLIVLTLMSMLAFGPLMGSACVFAAALLSASVSHRLGRWLGHEALLRLGGPRLQLLSQTLARRGWLAVLLMRLVPAAPFALVNMLAGATHLRLRHMLLGTALGITPSTLALALFAEQLRAALQHPGPLAWLGLALIVLLVLGAGLAVRRWLARSVDSEP
ncbi:VTT domain-containing protein [Paucibacter sp. APW11]|uniref:TVP38/TMEM64 family membrane protein n=1 Tax=Roseateles aquae TaxID=3077235 RepID=A0ABU3P9B3_9BURK|nr:VTT domain-containing protein [Paucibacter sp. APW11]MDT8998678.1 VTT domain-containing protein [Paucibacter sp. APW11]